MNAATETPVIYHDVNLITLSEPREWGAIRDGALVVRQGRIEWLGRQRDLPVRFEGERKSCHGAWMTPGLVDCHTHLVYGGNRIAEFERRLGGESYTDISSSGGGILSTVEATRSASEDVLYDAARKRLEYLIRDGVTTIEIKSGYGLDPESEMKMLRVARRLGRTLPVEVATTFLGAHTLPPEYANDRDGYVSLVCEDMIPAVAREGLADAVDCFCEKIAFSLDETRRVLEAARANRLALKLHAEQLSDMGGAALAARMGALSADHVEHVSDEAVKAMGRAGTVAVLLPGAFYTLGETKKPPIDAFRAAGVPMAVASDSNPGSSPVLSLRLMMNMACTLFALTPLEALEGVTKYAARALGLDDRGILAPGRRADLALWDITEPAELAYVTGGSLCLRQISATVPAAASAKSDPSRGRSQYPH
ncbi:MAG: imidazolonepropionase [Xanthomonadales bacterium]|nr:imidazolonepropionase [Xanthomonadales bacterium]